MIYAPFLTNADIGVGSELGSDGNPMAPAFVAAEGEPQALIIVPVADRMSKTQVMPSGDQ